MQVHTSKRAIQFFSDAKVNFTLFHIIEDFGFVNEVFQKGSQLGAPGTHGRAAAVLGHLREETNGSVAKTFLIQNISLLTIFFLH